MVLAVNQFGLDYEISQWQLALTAGNLASKIILIVTQYQWLAVA